MSLVGVTLCVGTLSTLVTVAVVVVLRAHTYLIEWRAIEHKAPFDFDVDTGGTDGDVADDLDAFKPRWLVMTPPSHETPKLRDSTRTPAITVDVSTGKRLSPIELAHLPAQL